MMKALAFILSVYVSILSCIVCNDSIETIAKTISVTQHTDNQHSEQSDLCAPFCNCSCCPGFVSLISTIQLLNSDISISKTVSEYLVLSPRGIAFSIFQPPRLG